VSEAEETSKAMKIPSLSLSVLGRIACVTALLLPPAMSHRAYAFGGVWSQTAPVKQAGEEVIFVDNPDSTVTAIVRIKYEGSSPNVAWVIPVPGKPTVGVSSTTVFQRLDAATAPQYWLEVTVEGTCKKQNDGGAPSPAEAGASGPASPADTAATSVTTIDQGSMSPYDFVDIAVDPTLSDPAKVATDWLTTNGYDLTHLESKVLGPYLRAGLHLLAFKLTKGADVAAIRPVILTYQSKLPMIPIRPTSLAAKGDTGIQVWVIGPSQAVPDNYRSLVINQALIDWLSAEKYAAGTLPVGGVGPFGPHVNKPSNYDAVVTAASREAGGQGFVTELGGPASQFRDKVWSSVDDHEFQMISHQHYADGIDAIFAAHHRFGGWDGWRDAVQGATTLPAGVTIDEFDLYPDRYRGLAKVDTAKFFQLLDKKVVKPVADTAAMFYRAPYLTRLYSTMRSDEMTVDPEFDYNADLAQVSNVQIAAQLIQCSPKLNQEDAPWRIKLPQGGAIRGQGRAWPVPEASMPANLKVVMLSTSGSGTIVKDNSEDIGMKLFKAAGTTVSDSPILPPPQNGLSIGGTQTVTTYAQTSQTTATPTASAKCSISRAGAAADVFARWLPLGGVILALRRRRRF
jgi:hypothetical protein